MSAREVALAACELGSGHVVDVVQKLMDDAQLAWRRVTELQARGTELVLERRDIEAKLADVLAYADRRDALARVAKGETAHHRALLIASKVAREAADDRAEAAKAKLAELVRQLRNFSVEYLHHNRHALTAADLERILAKYEAKP